jgi:hypothetical protein
MLEAVYKKEYGERRALLNLLTPEEETEYKAMKGNKAKEAFEFSKTHVCCVIMEAFVCVCMNKYI